MLTINTQFPPGGNKKKKKKKKIDDMVSRDRPPDCNCNFQRCSEKFDIATATIEFRLKKKESKSTVSLISL